MSETGRWFRPRSGPDGAGAPDEVPEAADQAAGQPGLLAHRLENVLGRIEQASRLRLAGVWVAGTVVILSFGLALVAVLRSGTPTAERLPANHTVVIPGDGAAGNRGSDGSNRQGGTGGPADGPAGAGGQGQGHLPGSEPGSGPRGAAGTPGGLPGVGGPVAPSEVAGTEVAGTALPAPSGPARGGGATAGGTPSRTSRPVPGLPVPPSTSPTSSPPPPPPTSTSPISIDSTPTPDAGTGTPTSDSTELSPSDLLDAPADLALVP